MSCTTHHHACECREAKFQELENKFTMLSNLLVWMDNPASSKYRSLPVDSWFDGYRDAIEMCKENVINPGQPYYLKPKVLAIIDRVLNNKHKGGNQ